ncbi:hypothetical protein FHS39_001383 [Streptomyces olivoverticillatus]|uniref:Uncharacterized protein n=1 Tax=Streptomyces olivoverticillatus TaxID=66427 RepID=A0A7W7LM86_9ACTN|nr:hypothetical protein [Streptomyces olivoverticillatus]MBB4892372.1 hypothetical protein [Streptomyces olivoverticillatus]
MDVDLKHIKDRIIAGLHGLEARQLAAVESVVRNMHRKIEFRPGGTRDLVSEAFRDEMSLFLVVHHALHERALNKENFEYVFKQCLIASGDPTARLNPNQKQAKFDVAGGGHRWSLKTESGDSMSRKTVKVEKLTEALWIRNSPTAEDCARNVREKVTPRLLDYDRIVVLRALRKEGMITYSLEEIPWSPLHTALMNDTRAEIFSKRVRGGKKAKSFGADYLKEGTQTRLFRMLLDTSVEKVRIWYALDECLHHGYWTLPASTSTNVSELSKSEAVELPPQRDHRPEETCQEELPF